MSLMAEIWTNGKPYLVCLITDALISYTLFLLLLAVKKLAPLMPIYGSLGSFLSNFYVVGTLLVFFLFGLLFLIDLKDLHNAKNKKASGL